jgi:hypothetical protein
MGHSASHPTMVIPTALDQLRNLLGRSGDIAADNRDPFANLIAVVRQRASLSRG